MKLVLRRIKQGESFSPYCLHTEDGVVLPQQMEITVKQRSMDRTRIIVEFEVDDDLIRLEASHN